MDISARSQTQKLESEVKCHETFFDTSQLKSLKSFETKQNFDEAFKGNRRNIKKFTASTKYFSTRSRITSKQFLMN